MSFHVAWPKIERVIVNGAPGVVVRLPARSLLGAFTVTDGLIVAIDLIADPDKLRGLPVG
jgi:RNA polymerase sigma-70 factor (ECF subfamily)